MTFRVRLPASTRFWTSLNTPATLPTIFSCCINGQSVVMPLTRVSRQMTAQLLLHLLTLLLRHYNGTAILTHVYDAAGQKGLLSTTTDFLGNVHAFTYTARNQLSTAGIPGQTVSYVYDPNGNQSQAYLPNGIRTDTYYIANNWRSSVYNISNTTGAVLSAYDCSFNADGQVTYTLEGHSTNPSTNNETTENFGYDGLGHLTSEVRNGTVPENISYAYDAAGNRTSQSGSYLNGTFSYDADDELTGFTYSGTSYASATFGYDANGERNTETTGLSANGGGYGTQYGYDFDGNLTAIAVSSGTTYFKYDGLDRQLGWVTSSGARLDYQLDGDAPLTETNQTTGQVNLYGNGLVSSGGETLLSDGLGAVRQTTNSSQSVQWSGTSQAFGVPLAASGGTANHYQWGAASGYRTDGFGPTYASPLLKVGARYYDPEFGCFLSRDTDLSQSPYAYCDGDPVNCSDPSGHKVGDPPPPGQSPDQGYGEPGGPDGDGGTTYPSPGGSGPTGGSGTITTGSGTVTVSAASGGTVSYSENNQKISVAGLGLPTQTIGTTNVVNLGSGFNLTGTNTYNLGTGASTHSGGLGYSQGGFTFSFSFNSNGTSSGMFGYKGSFD